MTTLREAAQQALEALLTYEQYIQPLTNVFGGPRVPEEGSASAKVDAAINALRAALAGPQSTHSTECYRWHHECAVAEVERLRAALAEPVQEPVAWLTPRTVDSYMRPDLGYETCSKTDYAAFPVYTAPPQRKPLTDEEIRALYDQHAAYQEEGPEASGWWAYTRAIERSHGIGSERPATLSKPCGSLGEDI